MPLLLTRGDLRPLMDDLSQLAGAFSQIEQAVLSQHRGEGGFTAFLRMPLAGAATEAASMYATSGPMGAGVRLFPFVGSPDDRGDQFVQLLLDKTSGGLVALMAGDDLNELRTSVPAGVGAKFLAPDGARVLCILGSGRQARSHARTFCHALPGLQEVVVWSPTPGHRQQFAEEMSRELDMPVRARDTAQAAVEGADVITATGALPAGVLAFEAGWVRSGTLVVTMTMAAPVELVDGARLVVPTKHRPIPLTARPGPPAAGQPAGPPAYGFRESATDLADVMLGAVPARERSDQTVVFELAAMYAWDVPILDWAYAWAREHGAGTQFSLTDG